MQDNSETASAEDPISIFIVSDATGDTALQVVSSALVQFCDTNVEIIQRPHINTIQRVRDVLAEAAQKKSLILHTIVSSELRHFILQESRLSNVDSMDILGPVLDRLSAHLKCVPTEEPGLYKHLAEGKTREIAAVEFAFKHDDGRRPEDLPSAEIVLVGISRSMKTPTMLYLAYHGWFTANIPLVLEVPVPEELFSVPSEKVFCLVMSESRLLELRNTRATVTKLPQKNYISPEYIDKEISYAKKLCRDHNWQLIDTTGKSVEEVAKEILSLIPVSDKTSIPY
jgi:hypothetical protein